MVSNSHFCSKFYIVELESPLKIRVIKSISVITGNDIGIIILNEFCKFQQSMFLGLLVENCHMARKLRFRLVIKLFYVISAKASIYYKESLSFIHQRYHHYLVFLRIWKFQRIFGCLNIISENFQLRDTSLPCCWFYIFNYFILQLDLKPFACPQSQINANSGVESYIVLAYISYQICNISDFFMFESIEDVIIIVVTFSSFVYYTLNSWFRSCKIFHCSKVDF